MARVLWTQRQDVGPSPRGGHALANDPVRERVVLFGGKAAGSSLQGDTWQWDGQDWMQVADTGPDARAGHALAFDSTGGRVVLFGGEAAGPTLRADTWGWDGEGWTQLADIGPDARAGHAFAFDAIRGRVVLFGGEAAGPALLADTWEWDGADWTQMADTGPAARHDHGMAFDVASERVVLFGGAVAGGNANDTWAWDGSEWTQVADMGPRPSRAVSTTFAGAAMLLFGGISSAAAPLGAEELSRLSWEWDGEHWTLRQDMGPAPRWGHALAFDSQRGRAVLFGGVSVLPGDPNVASSVLGDTWEAELEDVAPPPRNTDARFLHDQPQHDRCCERWHVHCRASPRPASPARRRGRRHPVGRRAVSGAADIRSGRPGDGHRGPRASAGFHGARRLHARGATRPQHGHHRAPHRPIGRRATAASVIRGRWPAESSK